MQLEISSRGFTLTASIRDYVRKRVVCNLTHGDAAVQQARVRLSDINGPRGGEDKRCHIALRLKGLPSIVVEDVEADLYVAIDRAAERAGRTLQRRLARSLRDAPPLPDTMEDPA